jgi:hypothetical protein
MDVSKPLRTLARPKASPFAIGFARELAPHFKGFERLEAESTDQGLLIGGVWQPDLDHAFEIVRRAFKSETTWEPSRIHYGEDEYGRPTEPYSSSGCRCPMTISGMSLATFRRAAA